MKSTRMAAIILMLAVCCIGWMGFYNGMNSGASEKKALADEAQGHQAAGRYQLAIDAYRQLVALDDDRAYFDAYLQTCEAFFQEDGADVAMDSLLEAYDEFTKAYPKETAVWEKYAQVYLDMKDYRNVVKVISRAELKKVESPLLQQQWNDAYYAYKHLYQGFTDMTMQALFNIYVVQEATGWGTIESTGKDMLNTVYTYMGPIGAQGHVLAVTAEGESRILDTEGVVYGRFTLAVEEARGYNEGLIAVRLKGREDWCFLDRDGKEVLSGYRNAGMFQEGKAAVETKEGIWQLIDRNGEAVSGSFEQILLAENGGFIFEDDLSMMKISGKWRLYSDAGEKDEEFSCDGLDGAYGKLIAYCSDGKWGFIDDDADVIMEPVYDAARSFSGGVGAVQKDGLWGFVDAKGNLVVDYTFAEVGYFDEASGTCPVRFPGEETYRLICWFVTR